MEEKLMYPYNILRDVIEGNRKVKENLNTSIIDNIDYEQLRYRVDAIINTLNEYDKKVLEMVYKYGKSQLYIKRALDLSDLTISGIKRRALREMRKPWRLRFICKPIKG